MRLKIYRLIWFLQKNNLKGGINVLTIHPFGLTKRGKILWNWIKLQKNPLQLLCAMELFTNQLQKWNNKNYPIIKTYGSIIYVWHSNYIYSCEYVITCWFYIYNLQNDLYKVMIMFFAILSEWWRLRTNERITSRHNWPNKNSSYVFKANRSIKK